MKRLAIAFVLVLLTWSASALELRWGLAASESVLFNTALSPTFSAGAVHVLAVGLGDPVSDVLRWEAGIELGVAGLGPQVLIPLGFSVSTDPKAEWSTEAAVHALVGGTFHQPWPSPLLGVESEVRGLWSWTPGASLGLSVGARLTSAPLYSATIAPYTVVEVPVRFVFTL